MSSSPPVDSNEVVGAPSVVESVASSNVASAVPVSAEVPASVVAPAAPSSELVVPWPYRLVRHPIMPVNRMSIDLRRQLPGEGRALFRVLYDRFDLAGGLFAFAPGHPADHWEFAGVAVDLIVGRFERLRAERGGGGLVIGGRMDAPERGDMLGPARLGVQRSAVDFGS